MGAVRGKGNRTTELRMRMGLVRASVSGWTSHPRASQANLTSYFEAAEVAVFVDGCFWHGCRKCGHIPKTHQEFWAAKIHRNRQRHRKVARLLGQHGIRTIRFWEHQLTANLDRCVARIQKQIQGPAACE
jgi:DNA mismatch endonuclease (patch repair protein)